MLHVGLDLSRTRLDVHAMDEAGTSVAITTATPDAGGVASLASRLGEFGQPVTAVIESMNGARFVHDRLELRGWTVEIADAVKVKGFAPLACKTDKIDAWVLAELSRRDLVPALWLPTPGVRGERERARWRLHLVRHRTALKKPDPRHPPGLRPSAPGLGSVRRGSVRRSRLARLAGQERPEVSALGADRGGHARRPPPPVYAARYQHTKTRLGRRRGPSVARVDIARRLTEAIWHMLTTNQPFAPAGATTTALAA
jgi:hypothetical protein